MRPTRRGFLGALLAASAAPAIVKAESLMKIWVPPRLTLWGDGLHDDTAALQALLDGNPVRAMFNGVAEVTPGGVVVLSRGVFKTSAPLVVRGDTKARISDSHFRRAPTPSTNPCDYFAFHTTLTP